MLSGCPYDINGITLSHFSHDSLFSHVDYRWITIIQIADHCYASRYTINGKFEVIVGG